MSQALHTLSINRQVLIKPHPHTRTGLPLSTYFSAIKLRWMIDHHDEVRQAHDEDDLLFGTVESWIAYVCTLSLPLDAV